MTASGLARDPAPQVDPAAATVPGTSGEARSQTVEAAGIRRWPDMLIAAAVLAFAAAISPLLAAAPLVSIGLLGSAALVSVAALRPETTTIVFVAVSPLLVGLGRGALVPGLRLNEVLLLPVLAGLALALIARWHRAGWRRPSGFHRLDLVVLALAFSSSISILLWMYARGREITIDDVLYALALWKLAVLYATVRLFIRSARAVRRLLIAAVATASVIGLIGLLQALGVGPVIDVLADWVPPEEGGYELTLNRATATLGNPIAYGDLLLYAAAIAASLAVHGRGLRRGGLGWWTLAAFLALCTLASGQFSILIGLATVAVVFAVVTRTWRRMLVIAPFLLAGAFVALQPVLDARLGAADPDTGLPISWTGEYGRLANLRKYFLPEIGADLNWLFGVQTAARVPGEESWQTWVYIESGYVWALWTGGLPLLTAILALIVTALVVGRRLARVGEGVARAVGTTLSAVAPALAFLLVLDPHLTLRGGGDLLFVLLALGATLDVGARAAAGEYGGRQNRRSQAGWERPHGTGLQRNGHHGRGLEHSDIRAG